MISPEKPASEAQRLMMENKVRHLPVVGDGKRLLGLVTRERLRMSASDLGSLNVWEISRYLSNLKVDDVMVKGKDLVTIGPNATLEAAAKVMAQAKIGCLPVLEENIVVGIITEVDMLVQLVVLLGGEEKGIRVTVRTPDKPGEMAKISNVMAENSWGIYASGSAPAPKRPGFWDVVLKVRNVPRDLLVAELKKIEGQEVIDVRETG
jgi:acetoin utilization protein AcuB